MPSACSLQVVLPQPGCVKHTCSLPCRSGQLDAKVSAAVIHYMLEVLPQLHDSSSVLAASVLCHILSGSAAPAQLLHSALATLRQLPFVSESGRKPSESQIQLACDLLQLFTVEAFQALPAPKVSAKAAKAASGASTDGFEVLLRFTRVGIKGHLGDSQQMTKLRVAAFEQLGADLYAVMPVQQQLQAFLVSPLPSVLPDNHTCLPSSGTWHVVGATGL